MSVFVNNIRRYVMGNIRPIAIFLENMLCKTFLQDTADEHGVIDRPIGTRFDATDIENGMFYDAMVLLLKNANIDFSNFEEKYLQYQDVNMNEIEDCESIYKEFKKLLHGK